MNSLRARLAVWILAGLLVVLVASGEIAYFAARSSLRKEFDRALVVRAHTLGAMVIDEPPDPAHGDAGGPTLDYAGPLDADHLGVWLRVTTADGRVLAQSPDWPGAAGAGGNDALARSGGEPVVSDITIEAETDDDEAEPVDGRMLRMVATAVREAPESGDPPFTTPAPPAIVLEIIAPTHAVDDALQAVLAAMILGGALAAVGAGAAVWVGVRRGLKPVAQLTDALERLRPQDPVLSIPIGAAPRELEPVVGAIDGLLSRVREAVDRERRFTDAAAHELRTPIAELRTITDVADRWPEPERLRKAVSAAHAIADEMEALMTSLLAAARGSDAVSGRPDGPVPLLELARILTLNGAVEQSKARGVSWSIDGDAAASWTGPRGVILAILRNLIDNAAAYTPAGGSVRIAVAGAPGAAALEIENGPVEIQPGEVDRIFEPFWRADPSRSDRSHRGLGLSIVDSLARGLGLRARAAVTADRRLSVCVSA